LKKHIPNILTIANLVCGCLAISTAFDGKLYVAAYYLIVASVFDFSDGFAARILNVSNPLGEQLDSLSDMVSFGIAPGILLYQFVKTLNHDHPIAILTYHPNLAYLAFLIPVFSAIRLAIFNLDTRQTTGFIGLPTPANTSLILFPIIIYFYPDLPKIIDVNPLLMPIFSNALIMLILGIFLAFLLVAEIPMFSLKFKTFKWKDNKLPFTFISIWLILLILININAMPVIVVVYILYSTFHHYFFAKTV